jgi:hypothetical protein
MRTRDADLVRDRVHAVDTRIKPFPADWPTTTAKRSLAMDGRFFRRDAIVRFGGSVKRKRA